MNWTDLGLIALALAVLVVAIKLHYLLHERKFSMFEICPSCRQDMFRVAHGAIFLSTAYMLAEFRWAFAGLGDQIPTMDDYLWAGIEAAFLLYIGWTCFAVRRLIMRSKEHKSCTRK